MNIENLEEPADMVRELRSMDDSQLIGQTLVQQGAIHAVSFILANGCTDEMALAMLESLRSNAAAIRAETMRRGKPELFPEDQIAFIDPAISQQAKGQEGTI